MIATRLMIAQQLMDAIIESESESGRACRRGVRRRPFSEMRADDDSGACLSQSGPRGETRARIGRGRSDSVCVGVSLRCRSVVLAQNSLRV
jgi:hypothetical protein